MQCQIPESRPSLHAPFFPRNVASLNLILCFPRGIPHTRASDKSVQAGGMIWPHTSVSSVETGMVVTQSIKVSPVFGIKIRLFWSDATVASA